MDLSKQIGIREQAPSIHQNPSSQVVELQLELTRQRMLLERERTAHKLTAELNAGQSRLLEMIAKGAPLKDTLSSLMLLIESQSEGVNCSTLLLDETGLLIRPGAAPNLPEEYTRLLDGIPIGPMAGSCGTAMFLKKQVIVTNLLEDPLWAPYKELIRPFGYMACWSTPIFLNQTDILGAFAMYYREQRSPDSHDMALIGFATHIAGIAIERTRREMELTRHRENLEDLITIRTSELTSANAEATETNRSLSTANQDLASALRNLHITQEELIQKEKLASLGSLVAGMAHELNTPVGNCMMAITTLLDRTRHIADLYQNGIKRSDLETYLRDAEFSSDIILRNLNRTANLVTCFKQVAVDQTTSQRRRFSVEETISNVLTTLQPSFGNHPLVVDLKIQSGLMMDSFPGALGQVITQLVTNAMQHGFEGRTAGVVSILAHGIDDNTLELTISDNGAGMSPENQQRVFEPFFTTRRDLGGTGLGLHIVHNIVTGLLGGRIRMRSELEIGTTFYLTLPCGMS